MDVQLEQSRAGLGADPQKVSEALGDEQKDRARPSAPSRALVATVVPILTASMAPSGIALARAEPKAVADALHGGIG